MLKGPYGGIIMCTIMQEKMGIIIQHWCTTCAQPLEEHNEHVAILCR